MLHPELELALNTDHPRVANDGALWAGRGLSGLLTGGVLCGTCTPQPWPRPSGSARIEISSWRPCPTQTDLYTPISGAAESTGLRGSALAESPSSIGVKRAAPRRRGTHRGIHDRELLVGTAIPKRDHHEQRGAGGPAPGPGDRAARVDGDRGNRGSRHLGIAFRIGVFRHDPRQRPQVPDRRHAGLPSPFPPGTQPRSHSRALPALAPLAAWDSNRHSTSSARSSASRRCSPTDEL